MVIGEIKSINPTAPIKTAMYSKVADIDWILDANCFDAERVKDVESAFQQSVDDDAIRNLGSLPLNFACMNPSCAENHAPGNDVCGLCDAPSQPPLSFGTHRHTSSVGTVALFGRGSVDLRRSNA